jgi:4-amino-4-deoxychorismate lyase
MCQFIETICYEQGQFQRIDLHNERCNRTRNHFFGAVPNLQLELFLAVPSHLKDETVKCKVTYGTQITGVEYGLYKIKPVKSLQLVYDDVIDYAFKYADRAKLDMLYQSRGQADDILIVKDGYITDTSYANIILKKDNKWYSPKNPLLHGTRIESYLRQGRVTPAFLRPEDLLLFSEARIVNAMISIENSPFIPIINIKS